MSLKKMILFIEQMLDSEFIPTLWRHSYLSLVGAFSRCFKVDSMKQNVFTI